MNGTTSSPPLTPAVFHILLALVHGEKHGYEIMKAVRHDSNGKVTMGNGTLYGSLKRMLADGMVEVAADRADDDDDARRKYYRLTGQGRAALNAELQRYLDTAAVIHRYRLASNTLAAGVPV
jgi:DNA-binding PadR family transcriptional regulator